MNDETLEPGQDADSVQAAQAEENARRERAEADQQARKAEAATAHLAATDTDPGAVRSPATATAMAAVPVGAFETSPDVDHSDHEGYVRQTHPEAQCDNVDTAMHVVTIEADDGTKHVLGTGHSRVGAWLNAARTVFHRRLTDDAQD